jgi:S1-C subfamily serine protease
LWSIVLVAGLAGAGLGVVAVAIAGDFGTKTVERTVVEKVAASPASSATVSPGQAVTDIAKSVAPAVARVDATTSKGSTTGSGVVFRDDGYLITNAHIVSGADTLTVVLADGTSIDGRVVGTDGWTDVAVIKIDRDHLPVATLGDSTSLKAGVSAIAIGAPLGLGGGPSVTVGVVSAMGQRVQSASGIDLHGMIQTDAPIAIGASGGALVDGSGVVVGITTAIPRGDDPAATSLGFATPIELAKHVADDIVLTGKAHHVWLGIEGDDLEPATASDLGVQGGVRVTKVIAQGPSANAGMQANDVITAVNNVAVASMSALVIDLRKFNPGDTVTLAVRRGSQTTTASVVLGEKDQP